MTATDLGTASLEAFASTFLGVLEAHDLRRHSALVSTLDAFLRHGGALAEAAATLGIHRNTLAYRLGRVAELTGYDLSAARQRFLLQLALAARSLLRALRAEDAGADLDSAGNAN